MDDDSKLPVRATWLDKLAWTMDNQFRVPGTRFRFGWDAIVGLIPGLGEIVTAGVQGFLILAAATNRDLPLIVAVRMLANFAVDTGIGSIPIVGDIFDFFFKANTRNMRLLKQLEEEHQRTGRVSRRPHVLYLAGIGVAVVAVFAAALTATFFVLRWLWERMPVL